jgi:hypothetical protein
MAEESGQTEMDQSGQPSEKVSPIVVFNVDENIKNSAKLLDNYFKEQQLTQFIKFTSVDRHNNTVFAKTIGDAKTLMEHSNFFDDNEKLNLNENSFKPAAIVKGLSYSEAKDHEEQLIKFGVVDIINLETKTSRLFLDVEKSKSSSCKLMFDSNEARDKIVKDKLMLMNKRFHVENSVRVAQCTKCKQFGHSSRFCKNEESCGRCSGHHHGEASCDRAFRCSNCFSDHSAYDRSCKIYQKHKHDQLEKTDKSKKNSMPPQSQANQPVSSSYINYSQATAPQQHTSSEFDQLMKKFAEVDESRKKDKVDLEKSLEKSLILLSKQHNELVTNRIINNNEKLGYCIFESMANFFTHEQLPKLASLLTTNFKKYGLADLTIQPSPQVDQISPSYTTLTTVPQPQPVMQQQNQQFAIQQQQHIHNQQQQQQQTFNHQQQQQRIQFSQTQFQTGNQTQPLLRPSTLATETAQLQHAHQLTQSSAQYIHWTMKNLTNDNY